MKAMPASGARLVRLFVALALVATVLGFIPAIPAKAATLTVDTLTDENDGSCSDGDCSLRDAIIAGSAGDTIDFSVTGTILLYNFLGELVIDKNLTISGPGADSLTIDADGGSRVFSINQGKTLNISGVKVTGGFVRNDNGGGFYVSMASGLSITNCVIYYNRAIDSGGGGGSGGGIYSYEGYVTAVNTAFTNNIATANGGAVYNYTHNLIITDSTFSTNEAYQGNGGGVYSSGLDGARLTISDSTFSGNVADDGNGGGVYNAGGSDLIITGSNFTGNHAENGGGIYQNNSSYTNVTNNTFSANVAEQSGGGIYNNTNLNLQYATFYGNTANTNKGGGIFTSTANLGVSSSIIANSGTGGNCAGENLASGSSGLADDATCTGFAQKTLGQLALGSLTGSPAYYPLLVGSHAVDAASGCTATDQRGQIRPLDGDGNGTAACDVGAFELEEPTTTLITTDTPEPSAPAQTVGVSVTISGGSSTPTGTVDITGADTNCTITLTSGSGSCDAVFNTAGAKTLTATYNGDATHLGSSGTESHTVNKVDTTLTIVDDPDPSFKGQDVTISFTVTAISPGSGTPSGVVDIMEGKVVLCDNVELISGSGSCIIPFNSYGSHPLSAKYNGDSSFNGSTDTEDHQVDDRAPTGIGLSTASVAENMPDKTLVGVFTTTDADPDETFKYELVDGEGSDDNGSFTIDDDDLRTADVFDFEKKSSYSIRVSTTDSGELSLEEIITITVTNANEAPEDIILSNSAVAEGQPAGTVVGTLTTTDPDVGDTYTYSFCGGADDVSFQIGGAGNNELHTAEVFDYETKVSYAICIRTTDLNELFYDENFNITVNNVNEAPVITEGTSANVTMSEDGSPTAFSLTLHASDVDGNTITWNIKTLASHGTASASGTGTSKVISYTPNANYNGSDAFVVQVSDGNGGTDTITVNVTINSVNDTPIITEGTSANVTMSEDGSPTAFSLTLHATDIDADTLTWSIKTLASHGTASASGTGTSKVIGYTPNANYNGSDAFVVQVSDGNGGTDTITVNVTINSVNDTPIITEGTSANVTMSEDGSPTAFSLTLHATDIDADTITWSISTPASHGTASASGTGTSKVISYTPNANHNGSDAFVVQASDGNGGTDTITVNVTITAVNDAPTNITLSSSKVSENRVSGAVVGTLRTTDPDVGQTFTYRLTSASGCSGTDNSSFRISSSSLKTKAVFNYESKKSYKICIQTNDGHGGTFRKQFTIKVTDLPETFTSTGKYDGWVLESSETSSKGGSLNATATTFYLGDDVFDRQYRAILSFDTSALPNNATITKVTLKIKRQGIVGTNPFSTHSSLYVDIKKGTFSSVSLQTSDFQATPNLSSAGTFSKTLLSGNRYQAVLKSSARAYVNRTGVTQLRLRFYKGDNDDRGADYLKLYSGNYPISSFRPVLLIEYTIP